MDETLSWRARLAKANINILNIAIMRDPVTHNHSTRWYYEFMYHPHPGQTKWCKTYYDAPFEVQVPEDDPVMWHTAPMSEDDATEHICEEVLSLRKELEG